jgi:hypothetical protein
MNLSQLRRAVWLRRVSDASQSKRGWRPAAEQALDGGTDMPPARCKRPHMTIRTPPTLLFIALALGCANQSSGTFLAHDQGTGLEGMVRHGPVQPVCRVGQPCDAPFSAAFQVWQQQQLVTKFQSDSTGHYRVLLAPGAYTIVPDSGAPIWPRRQAHDVTVGSVGVTHLDLNFDTGVR